MQNSDCIYAYRDISGNERAEYQQYKEHVNGLLYVVGPCIVYDCLALLRKLLSRLLIVQCGRKKQITVFSECCFCTQIYHHIYIHSNTSGVQSKANVPFKQ